MTPIPPAIRPVYQYRGRWQRQDCLISCDGHSINWGGRLVSEATDISAKTGGAAYAARLDGVLTVFDFSGSHICPCKLYLATKDL